MVVTTGFSILEVIKKEILHSKFLVNIDKTVAWSLQRTCDVEDM